MRKSDLVNNISEKTGIPKVDVLVTLETLLNRGKYLYPWFWELHY